MGATYWDNPEDMSTYTYWTDPYTKAHCVHALLLAGVYVKMFLWQKKRKKCLLYLPHVASYGLSCGVPCDIFTHDAFLSP